MILGTFFQNVFVSEHDEKVSAATVNELNRTLVRGEEVALPIVQRRFCEARPGGLVSKVALS
jgi:hypothetical protein